MSVFVSIINLQFISIMRNEMHYTLPVLLKKEPFIAENTTIIEIQFINI